jgi:hypothetical protein
MGQPLASESKRCGATSKNGQQCRALALAGSPFCFSHAPERAQERAEARKRGGFNSSTAARLQRLIPARLISIYDVLEASLLEVHDGKLEPARATAMAAISRAMVTILTAGELEERLRAVEQKTATK